MVEVHPARRETKSGLQVQFNCTTESWDQFGVEWLFYEKGSDDSITICSGDSVYDKYECKNEAHRHTLVIKNVRYTDSGTYTCVEDGGRGPGSNSSTLTVSARE